MNLFIAGLSGVHEGSRHLSPLSIMPALNREFRQTMVVRKHYHNSHGNVIISAPRLGIRVRIIAQYNTRPMCRIKNKDFVQIFRYLICRNQRTKTAGTSLTPQSSKIHPSVFPSYSCQFDSRPSSHLAWWWKRQLSSSLIIPWLHVICTWRACLISVWRKSPFTLPVLARGDSRRWCGTCPRTTCLRSQQSRGLTQWL